MLPTQNPKCSDKSLPLKSLPLIIAPLPPSVKDLRAKMYEREQAYALIKDKLNKVRTR